MTQGLRWQIWAPRLMLIGVIVLAVQYGLGLAVRSFAIRSGEAAMGAHVDVGNTRVSLWDQQVVLNDIRLTNPRCPGADLVEADRCELEFATKPLLHKEGVATRGRLSGVRFSAFSGGETKATGEAATTTPAINWFRDQPDIAASQWFVHLAERFKQNMTDQLESVQRTEAFCESWASQSAEFETRGQALNDRVASLQKSVEASQANPLRGDKALVDLPQTIADLQQDFAALNAELAKLPDQLETERRAIVAARRHDEELLRKKVTLEPIEANALSAYLLRTQAVKPLDEFVGWLRWMREAAPAVASDETVRTRGEDIIFAGCKRGPSLLVKALELRGSARIANQPVELRGTLTGLSSQPSLVTEPMRLRLETTGSMPLELQATIDRTNGAKRDALLMDCQGILMPRMALGKSDQLAVAIAPSLGSLSVSLTLDGEKLTGEIQMVQQNVRITPALAGEFADVPIGKSLEETLGRIDSLATRVSLGGTLAQPTCTLWSNLGPAVAEAIEQALERAGGQHARSQLVEAGKQVDERLTTVERQMAEQQARWNTRVADVRAQLQAFAASEAPSDRLTPQRVGRRLPSNSLFR
jgi:uncharacterized protein (TIGR03545 family)